MERFWLTFDEFFKLGTKTFFEAFNFRVETEFELYKLPKKLDVLIIRMEKMEVPDQFHTLKYFGEYNLISYKSPKDRIRKKDITDAIIYLNGYINITKTANYLNTTMTILCNHTPELFLKKNSKHISELTKGKWLLQFGFFNIHLINLNLIDTIGIDDCFLKDFSETESFRKSLKIQTSKKAHRKIFDILKEFWYIRINSFEDLSFKEIKMPLTMKADITDLVSPYYEKGKLEGEIKGKLEGEIKGKLEGEIKGEIKGKLEGEIKGKLITARNMKKEGMSTNLISKITGLTKKELIKNKIL